MMQPDPKPFIHIMKRVIIFLLLIFICVSSYAQPARVEVTYVGNAGFLINIGDKKILTDALFKGFEGSYQLPQEVQDKLRLAQAPFDDVDLILVTHAHGDHIDPDMVNQHMHNNPGAIFGSTRQLVDALNAVDTLDVFKERRIPFDPVKGGSEVKDIGGISIETFYLPHGTDARIINIGFLISVNGITLFQTGDADFDQFSFDEFRSLRLPERDIDLAFIQHYYLDGDSLSTKFVKEGIGGDYILPIHYHFTTPLFDSAIVRENYPDAVIFNKEMQSWSMPDKLPISTGYLFNQPPPGDSAVIFAPGIFSLTNRLESNIAFTPDGRECYFGTLEIRDRNVSYKIYQSRYVNGKWTEQAEAPFSLNKNMGDPVLSADGKKLYINKEGDFWMLERTADGWGEPQLLPAPINSEASEGSITESADGVMYISSRRPEGFGGIDNWRISRLADQSLLASNLGPIFNSRYFDYSPFIAPDGSYLIFGSYRAGRDGLLYISFNQGNDHWTTPVDMNICGAKVNNTTAHHSNPSLSPDGKYLFFRRHEADTVMDVYWVNAEIINEIKTGVFADISLNEEMFKAVDEGDLAKVKALVNSNNNLLEIKDQVGSTPLIRACLNFQTFGREVEIAKFLIEAGADVNVINNYRATALLRASVGRGPDNELIKLLVSKGADVNVQGYNGITALHWAVKDNNLQIAKLLLKSGANINISNDYNGPVVTSTISGTVLQVAINYSQSNEMVKFVIENGAKLNIKDSQGNTELHLVALKGDTEQAKILIRHGIDLNTANNFNRTALYYAAKHGYRGVAELLLASGADKSTIVETNYGKAKQLSESLAEGEAYIWDLNFSYAVKTKNNLLVFTLGGVVGESSKSGLANGFLNADELKDQKITIFLRHRGNWPMDGKKFTELAKLTSDVEMVSSIKPDFSKMEESEIPAYRLALPNENFSVDGVKVHTIPALASGMGYLVEVDGLKIFHAGLHISDDKPEHIERYRKEIDFLKPFGPIDIVMLPTHSHSNEVGTGYEQYLYLLDQLEPKAIYLWGANVPEQYLQCADFLKSSNIPITYPELNQAAGERFHYPDVMINGMSDMKKDTYESKIK
jgi:ankyrin repeat protein/L-ascorbate metabolism protein UlaG (beta-lactamase superfamily)